ncbi:MAG: hypothetical protein RKP73_03400 [Candidatus Contendobacter sp.]|nr:hypothetical protein [Candidatus Contendobacter sp.]
MSIEKEASDESPDTRGETQPPAKGNTGLSERGIRAVQGASAEKVNSGRKGSNFERWARDNVFSGESRRLTMRIEDEDVCHERVGAIYTTGSQTGSKPGESGQQPPESGNHSQNTGRPIRKDRGTGGHPQHAGTG